MLNTENSQCTALLTDFPHSQHRQNQDCCGIYRLQELEIYMHNQANQPSGINKPPLVVVTVQENLAEVR